MAWLSLLYSPIFSNIKFFGVPGSFFVRVFDPWNYSAYLFYGLNYVLEVLTYSLPLLTLQILIIKE